MRKANRRSSFILIFSAIFLVACGKDKSLDDYRREQANAAFSQMQEVAGTYRGTLVNQGTGQQIGALELVLDAVMLPVSNGDNTGTAAQAGLQGSVTIVSGSRASGVISTASFLSPDDSRNGSISGRISVPLGGNNSASFSLNGTLLNGNFSGLISPSDRAGSAGRFTLQKGAPLPRGQGEIGPGGGGQLREFSGSFLDRTCEGLGRSNLCRNPGPVSVPVKMAINSAPANAGFFFVNLFSDVRIVSVQLDLDGVVLPLPSCEFDQRSNSLHFQGLIQGTGGSGSQTTFDCIGRGAGYSCSYRNEAFGATYQFEVSPSKPGAIK